MVAMVMQSEELHGGELKRLKAMQCGAHVEADSDVNFESLRPIHPSNSNRDTDGHHHGIIHKPSSSSSSSSSSAAICCDHIKICSGVDETLDFHIPGFQILGLLGEGSYGRVYKAKKKSNRKNADDAQEQFVALKVFKTPFSADKADTGYCPQPPPESRMEMAMSMMLSKQATTSTPIVKALGFHFHVCRPVNGYRQYSGNTPQVEAAMSMEFCHGGSLLDFRKGMDPAARMGEREARLFVRPIAMALQFCHGRDVLHLDVKPGNILLRERGRLGSAALADFGLGLVLPKGSHYAESAPGRGTRSYMAPEADIYGIYSASSDVWSLGAVS